MTKDELASLTVNYEGLLEQKNDIQKAMEAFQDNLEARIALDEENEVESEEPPVMVEIDKANDVIEDYYLQMQKLEDSNHQLEIENALLREIIAGYTE